ncbi:hypothetical protein CRI94_06515 [Longibacter salinarum]|uniref:Uncharacterized protein n=2 Tax=Longibacter salinarum TaxID=1850348 RepID=A0A2A8CYP2_9BACT|nr:hypothetical protein CRI94_06515 [Longibacter salinarum]
MLPFGSARPPQEDILSPEMREYAMKIYREAWDAYKGANCPYGETDEAMLVWYSFRRTSDGENVVVGKN